MQKTERYGILALLLLVITLVAVGAWGERPEQVEGLIAEAPSVTRGQQVLPSPISVPIRREWSRELPVDAALGARDSEAAPGALAANRVNDARNARVRRAVEAKQMLQAQRKQEAQREQEMQRHQRVQVVNRQRNQGAEVLIPDRSSSTVPGPASHNRPERVHVVRAGEVFSTIVEKECGGKRFTGQVLACNPGLNPDRIFVGMKLMLPAQSGSVTANQSTNQSSNQSLKATPSPSVALVSRPSRTAGRLRSMNVYTVQSGDVLSRIIAAECPKGVELGEVLALNGNMNPNRIFVGQELRLPRSSRVKAVSASTKKALAPGSLQGPTHRVAPGEFLGRIAANHGCTVANVMAVNPGLNPDRIAVGQVLNLPAALISSTLADAPVLAQASGLGGRRWSGVQ